MIRFPDTNEPYHDYGYMTCPTCDGEGSIDGEECPECEGTGTVARTFEDELDDYYTAMEEKWEADREDNF